MATDKTRLGNAIKARIEPMFADNTNPPNPVDVWVAISDEILNELITHMEVKGVEVQVTGVPVSSGAPVPVLVAFPAGTGATTGPVMASQTTPVIASQNNDGTGHLA